MAKICDTADVDNHGRVSGGVGGSGVFGLVGGYPLFACKKRFAMASLFLYLSLIKFHLGLETVRPKLVKG